MSEPFRHWYGNSIPVKSEHRDLPDGQIVYNSQNGLFYCKFGLGWGLIVEERQSPAFRQRLEEYRQSRTLTVEDCTLLRTLGIVPDADIATTRGDSLPALTWMN